MIFVGLEKPSFDSRCKIYEMDPCDGYGRVCLVFRENKTGTIMTNLVNYNTMNYFIYRGIFFNLKMEML